MELGTTKGGQPIVERPPQELVREAVREPGGGNLLDDPAAHRFVQCRQQAAFVEPGRAPDDIEPELGPATAAASRTSVVDGASRDSRPLTTSRTLSGLPSSASGRASLPVPSPISSAPASVSVRHSSVIRKGVAVGQLVDGMREFRQVLVQIASGGSAHELGDLLVAQPGEPERRTPFGAPQVDQRL